MLVNVVYAFITTGIKGDQRFYFPPVLLPSAVSATQYHLAHEEKSKLFFYRLALHLIISGSI